MRLHGLIGLMSLFSCQAFAEKISLKSSIEPQYSWILCSLFIIIFAVIAFILAKKNQHSLLQSSSCLIIDKKRLSTTTMIYIIEYHQQRFLIADNQQGLTLHYLNHET